MKPKNMKQSQKHPDDGGGILIWGFVLGVLMMVIGALWWIGAEANTKSSITVECEITTPYILIQSGWKIMGPEDDPAINALALTGKVEKKSVDGLVSCTRYEAHKTPITNTYALMLWRGI